LKYGVAAIEPIIIQRDVNFTLKLTRNYMHITVTLGSPQL